MCMGVWGTQLFSIPWCEHTCPYSFGKEWTEHRLLSKLDSFHQSPRPCVRQQASYFKVRSLKNFPGSSTWIIQLSSHEQSTR